MSLFKGSLRPPAILSDEAIERYLAAMRAQVQIDPLFRRRLRGEVVNRYVADREGHRAGQRQRHMGKLGRAVLYATFSLAVSVTGVLAASQEALPGEALYALKRNVEELRLHVLPTRFHPELAAYALSERIGEMDRLAEAGEWAAVARLATTVEADYVELRDMDPTGADEALHQHFVVLHGLLERLPDGARSAIQATLDRASEPRGRSSQTPSSQGGRGPADGTNNGAQPGGPDDRSASPKPTRSPKPEATPRATTKPDPTPRAADRSPRPDPTPRAADRSPRPDPTPKATKSPKADRE